MFSLTVSLGDNILYYLSIPWAEAVKLGQGLPSPSHTVALGLGHTLIAGPRVRCGNKMCNFCENKFCRLSVGACSTLLRYGVARTCLYSKISIEFCYKGICSRRKKKGVDWIQITSASHYHNHNTLQFCKMAQK